MVPGPSQRASIMPKVALLSCWACTIVADSIVMAGKSVNYFFIVLVLVLKNPVLAGFLFERVLFGLFKQGFINRLIYFNAAKNDVAKWLANAIGYFHTSHILVIRKINFYFHFLACSLCF